MSINMTVEAAPTTPPASTIEFYGDATKIANYKDDAGFIRCLGRGNFSTASQAPAAATRTYITGSAIAIPASKLQIGTWVRWTFDMTKTAAGTAASTIDVAFGTAGTTADTARVSFTKPAGTAVADTAIVTVICKIRGPLSASGIAVGNIQLVKNAAATAGHVATPSYAQNVVSSTFDVTTPTFMGLCITTGTADAITIQDVVAEAYNL